MAHGLLSADVDEAMTKASDAGGSVVMGPMDVFDSGRMGVVQDPVGSFVSVWQPKEHIGAELANEPGAFTWNELATTDLAAARDFYGSTFGWSLEDPSTEEAAIFTVGGKPVCGAHTVAEGEFPAWSIWFAVEDCDASAAKAEQLGGSVLMPPNDLDFGRGAVVADPHGAVFGVGTLSEAVRASVD